MNFHNFSLNLLIPKKKTNSAVNDIKTKIKEIISGDKIKELYTSRKRY